MCFRSGAFAAVLVISLCVGGICSLYGLCLLFFGSIVPTTETPLLIVGYGFGASFVALFMQLGGGIYTKAADVGAGVYCIYIYLPCFQVHNNYNILVHMNKYILIIMYVRPRW